MKATCVIDFASHRFEPRADRSLWWPARKTLIVADLHVGKAAVFRARGVPVPEGATSADLLRLDAALDATGATRLLLLGDLFHARESIDHAEALAPLVAWRERRATLDVVLVRGNHDRRAGQTPSSLAFNSIDGTLVDDGIEFAHEPLDDENGDVALFGGKKRGTSPFCRVAGHVHPVVRLDDFDGSSVRVPCVCVDPMQMILPAFSQFTGGATMARAPGRTLYAIAAGRVVRV